MPPRDPDGGEGRLLAVTHNVWSGQTPAAVRRNLTQLVADVAREFGEKPHALLLQEAWRFDGTIHGYQRIANDGPHRDDSNNVVLVRTRGVTVRREDREIQGGDEPWLVVKHNKEHPPRLWPAPVLEVAGVRWDVVDIHRAPSRKTNAAAWKAEHNAIVDFADRRRQRTPRRPLLMGGDWQSRRSDDDPLSVSALAAEIDAEVKLRGIDGWLTRGCTGRAVQLASKYGSDTHNPVVLIGWPNVQE